MHATILEYGKNADVENLLKLARRHSGAFTQVDCVVFLQALEMSAGRTKVVSPTVDNVVTKLKTMMATGELHDVEGSPVRTFASACTLFCKLGFPLPQKVPIEEIPHWDAQHVSMTAWAYAKALQMPQDGVFETIAKDVQQRYYQPRCASNVAWACATVYPTLAGFDKNQEKSSSSSQKRRDTQGWMAPVMEHITKLCLENKPHNWTEHDVGNLCWAIASFPSTARDVLFTNLAESASKGDPTEFFSTHGLMQVVWAMSRAEHEDAPIFVRSAAIGIDKKNLWSSLSAQHFANLMWALGKNRVLGLPVELWDAASKNGPLPENGQDLANVVWAYERVNYRDESAFDRLAHAAIHTIQAGSLTPQGLANAAWAFRRYEGEHKQHITEFLVNQCKGVPVDQWSTKTLAILGRQLPSSEVLTLMCNDFLLRADDYTIRDVAEVRSCVLNPQEGLGEKMRRDTLQLANQIARSHLQDTRKAGSSTGTSTSSTRKTGSSMKNRSEARVGGSRASSHAQHGENGSGSRAEPQESHPTHRSHGTQSSRKTRSWDDFTKSSALRREFAKESGVA